MALLDPVRDGPHGVVRRSDEQQRQMSSFPRGRITVRNSLKVKISVTPAQAGVHLPMQVVENRGMPENCKCQLEFWGKKKQNNTQPPQGIATGEGHANVFLHSIDSIDDCGMSQA